MRGTVLVRLSALLAVLGLIVAMANPAAAARPEVLKLGKKSVVVDVGTISFSDTLYLGDLSTTADNSFISSEITGITGPHPEAESDFVLFCQIATAVLG
jgi:hypothetical protein